MCTVNRLNTWHVLVALGIISRFFEVVKRIAGYNINLGWEVR